MKQFIVCLFVIFSLSNISAKEYKVYYFGGQSNMEGFGENSEIPSGYCDDLKSVMIFQGNPVPDNVPLDGKGEWTFLRPGHGYGFHYVNDSLKYSHRFGPEIGFAKKMRELTPEENIAILKYAKDGSAIELGASKYGSWDPDYEDGNKINQFDHFLNCLNIAFSDRDIDGDGEEDTLIPAGIIWMQGESDAYHTKETALKYEKNLKRLTDLIRAALRRDDIPIVIGEIADSGKDEDGKVMLFPEIVIEEQNKFVENDPYASIVKSTKSYQFVDRWHFSTPGVLDLGEKFAEKLYELNNKK